MSIKIHAVFALTLATLAAAPSRAADFSFQGKVVPQLSSFEIYEAGDARLQVGDAGVTVADLSLWAKTGQDDKLETLFKEYAVTMACLPEGPSIGDDGGVLARYIGQYLSLAPSKLAEVAWHGKIFEKPQADCRLSKGNNRLFEGNTIEFVTRIVNRPDLALSRAWAVELNYADTGSDSLGLAYAVQKLGVYDLMVAIPGKYGPIYVGKTWIWGTYKNGTAAGSFTTSNPGTVAWYFLDFNPQALERLSQERLTKSKAESDKILKARLGKISSPE